MFLFTLIANCVDGTFDIPSTPVVQVCDVKGKSVDHQEGVVKEISQLESILSELEPNRYKVFHEQHSNSILVGIRCAYFMTFNTILTFI